MRVLVKLPKPVPSVVLESRIVGSWVGSVFQQTPRAVTGEPPSLVTVPPLAADVVERTDAADVVITGKVVAVVVETWFPYDVPAVLVA